MTQRNFSGDVVDYYAHFRRGFPPGVVDTMVATLGLRSTDRVVDLGCGTGQLAVPLAERVRAVIAMDPEPDMLTRARERERSSGDVDAVSWLLGSDADLPRLRRLLGDGTVGAVTIATAIHLMDHEALFAAAAPLLRPGGAVAIVANGTPLWRYDTDWSRTAEEVLAEWFGISSTSDCGTDAASRGQYREALLAAGYEPSENVVEYSAELSVTELTGNIFSALGNRLPSPAQRLLLADKLRRALHPVVTVTEPVRVATLIGRRPQ